MIHAVNEIRIQDELQNQLTKIIVNIDQKLISVFFCKRLK